MIKEKKTNKSVLKCLFYEIYNNKSEKLPEPCL